MYLRFIMTFVNKYHNKNTHWVELLVEKAFFVSPFKFPRYRISSVYNGVLFKSW